MIKGKDTSQKKAEAARPHFYHAVGRRKEANARIRLYVSFDKPIELQGKSLQAGDILVNGRPVHEYFRERKEQAFYLEPLRVTETLSRFAVSVVMSGGGLAGQKGAFVHGVARALEKADPSFRSTLKKHGFLTRDARAKERRKAGFAQKARAKKQSPKR